MSIRTLRRSWQFCVLTALTLAVPCARGDIVEVISGGDTTIFENNPDNSLGGGVTIYAGRNQSGTAGSPRRALIAFDVSFIPPGSTVDGVQLELVLADFSGGEVELERAIGLHKLLSDWGEGTAGWGEGPGGTGQGRDPGFGDATWNHRFHDTDPWTNPGGDFADAASATAMVGQEIGSTYMWSSLTMAADVQQWVNDPSSNFGWLLMGDESAKGTFRTFWSKEAYLADNSAYEPRLVIDYTPVPEPSSLLLLAGGVFAALVMIRRGRRR